MGGDPCAGAVCRQRGVCALLGQEQRLELFLGSVPPWFVLVILSALSSPSPSCPSLWEAPHHLPQWLCQSRSCHLPSSLNSFLASF